MKEYKSRKNRKKYSRKLAQQKIEEQIMDLEENNIFFEQKNMYSQKEKKTAEKIKKLHDYVESFISGERSNDMVCCNHAQAKIIEKLYNVKMLKKEPVNRKYGLFMFQIIL